MRQQDDLAALVGYFGDGRRDALEPGGVGDAAVLHWHIEIDAQQHAFAPHVDVIEGAACFGHFSLLSRALRSAVRCRTGTHVGARSRLCGAAYQTMLRIAGRTLHRVRDTRLTAASPSPRRCPPCGWRNPIHYRTTPSPAPACRSAPWSGPCGTWRNAGRG